MQWRVNLPLHMEWHNIHSLFRKSKVCSTDILQCKVQTSVYVLNCLEYVSSSAVHLSPILPGVMCSSKYLESLQTLLQLKVLWDVVKPESAWSNPVIIILLATAVVTSYKMDTCQLVKTKTLFLATSSKFSSPTCFIIYNTSQYLK